MSSLLIIQDHVLSCILLVYSIRIDRAFVHGFPKGTGCSEEGRQLFTALPQGAVVSHSTPAALTLVKTSAVSAFATIAKLHRLKHIMIIR